MKAANSGLFFMPVISRPQPKYNIIASQPSGGVTRVSSGGALSTSLPRTTSYQQATSLYRQPSVPTTSTSQPSGAPSGGGGGGQPSGPSADDLIEQEYQSYLGQLAGQEEGLNRQADISKSEINTGYGSARAGLENEQNKKLGVLGEQETSTQRGEQGALRQARDMFRQMQQQNIAQLSGLGISSSSVAEALAENLGRDTAQRIFSISQILCLFNAAIPPPIPAPR